MPRPFNTEQLRQSAEKLSEVLQVVHDNRWGLTDRVTSAGYKSSHDARRDAIRVGKLAQAEEHISEAIAIIGDARMLLDPNDKMEVKPEKKS